LAIQSSSLAIGVAVVQAGTWLVQLVLFVFETSKPKIYGQGLNWGIGPVPADHTKTHDPFKRRALSALTTACPS